MSPSFRVAVLEFIDISRKLRRVGVLTQWRKMAPPSRAEQNVKLEEVIVREAEEERLRESAPP